MDEKVKAVAAHKKKWSAMDDSLSEYIWHDEEQWERTPHHDSLSECMCGDKTKSKGKKRPDRARWQHKQGLPSVKDWQDWKREKEGRQVRWTAKPQ
eukprot:4734204-Amphidinium_carterae.1